MAAPLNFTVHHQCTTTHARVGRIETPHGGFDTPAFLPVGSRAAVKGLTVDQLRAAGAQIVLANAYHLMLRPGHEVVARLENYVKIKYQADDLNLSPARELFERFYSGGLPTCVILWPKVDPVAVGD